MRSVHNTPTFVLLIAFIGEIILIMSGDLKSFTPDNVDMLALIGTAMPEVYDSVMKRLSL